MNRRNIFGIIAVFVVGLVAFRFFRSSSSTPRSEPGAAQQQNSSAISSSLVKQAEQAKNPQFRDFGGYPPWHGGRAMNLDDPRWRIVDQRDKTDPKWEWKMPINFYGKVVDQTGQPVAGTTVKFSWTDTSDKGTSQQQTASDANGLFELRGVHGKNLGVQVRKQGYEVARSKNLYSFEYASFGDEHYHEADPKNPVIFYLHKKGEAAPLIHSKKEVDIAVGKPVVITLGDQTQLQFTLASNANPLGGTWEAQVSISHGGIIPAVEEFNTEAPLNGYQTTMALTPETPKPPKWELYEGGYFYFKAGENYGRLNIEMIPGHDWVRFEWWLNPKSGSRNLEYDPAKEIKSGLQR